MTEKKKTFISLDYAGIQGFYSMIYAGIGAFFSAFLLKNGFTNTEIGLTISCANLLTVAFSPFVADFADHTKKVGLNQIILADAAAVGVLTFFLFFLHGHIVGLFVVYVLALAFHGFLQPLVNALNFRIEEKGYHLNFGICRSAGSICYAVMTAIVGSLIDKAGILAIPSSSILSTICLAISLLLLQKHLGSDNHIVSPNEKEDVSVKMSAFIRNNIPFLIFNIGVVFLFFHSYVIGSFMLKIIEPMGGDAADMGRMFSLAAAVEVPAMMSFDFFNRKISSGSLLKFSMLGFIAKNVLLLTAHNLAMVYAAQLMQIFGYAVFYPAAVKFIGEKMSRGEAVKGQSLFTMMMTVSGVIANCCGGVILDTMNVHILEMICLITAVIGALIIVLMTNRLSKSER